MSDEPEQPKVSKHESEWREQLSPEQYYVTRQCGTERAFTGKYWNTKTPGVYRCVCCGAELFTSDDKYDSGSGWPSFTRPVAGERVAELVDRSPGMTRVEVRCRSCDAHLGHVFEDGPRPTGMRFWINSAALELEARELEAREDDE